ncbi:MAG: agmatine deiminase, partial [Bacilli bacterium]
YANAKKFLNDQVEINIIENDDAWMRDVGPTFLVNDKNSIRAVDWRFNAWGGKLDGLYDSWDLDDKVAKRVCELSNVDYYSLSDFVLEGGSIHTDGEGTVIVTTTCLLHESRNPKLSKQEIENKLNEYLGTSKVIWLPYGIYGDETNGHVDNIIHFCDVCTICLAWTDDKTSPQYEMSKEVYDYLKLCTDAKGRKFKIYKLHIPNPVIINESESAGVINTTGTLPRKAGDRMAASYTNFYMANGAIILPLFNDENDIKAINTLKDIFPTRKIEGIYAREILLGGGNIHCITQQQPLLKGECYEE